MKILVIIDMQKDFINRETYSSIDDINKLIKKKEYDDIIFTRYNNDERSLIYKSLGYEGCRNKESKQLVINSDKYRILDKTTYSAYEKLKKYLTEEDEIHLCGIDADCCVLVTAINLFENNFNVYVLKDFVYCMNGKETLHEALHILERNIGKNRLI